MFSFARRASLCLDGGGPSRLKMNSLRSVLTAASPATNHQLSRRRKASDELTQPQNTLTPTGLLIEGQCTFPERSGLELILRDLSATTTAYASLARLAGFTAGWNPGSVLVR
jgi:hypothetical protein